ncbi:MAG: glycosyltransferase family 9 protein [Veillonellaceae bacterium]|nr:glycosyltransferase family 9 protein [Veillonellaceae bacterium]
MNRILIIRLDGLGDTLLSLPLLDGLKHRWPDCEITYLASPRGASVFDADPRVSHLWVHELANMSRTQKCDLGKRIRAAGFDLVFCLNEKFWPAVWTYMSNATIRVGFDPGWSQLPKTLLRHLTLTHRLPAPNDPAQASIHEVERYAALAGLAGCPDAAGPMRLMLPPATRAWAGTALAGLTPDPAAPLIGLHLSAKWTSEGWGDGACLTAARSLLDRFPQARLAVTAGPGEEKFFETAAAVLPAERYRLFCRLELMQWAALIARCRSLVSMDTGAVHLAAAVGTPAAVVFPEKNFVHASSRWSPWQVPHRILRRPAPGSRDEFYADLCAAVEELL